MLLYNKDRYGKNLSELDQKVVNAEVACEREVKILKSRIVQRPSEILCIHKELFKIFERAVIYLPMYEVTFRNAKTRKGATLIIDGITGKTSSGKLTPDSRKKETAEESLKSSPSRKNGKKKVSGSLSENENKVEIEKSENFKTATQYLISEDDIAKEDGIINFRDLKK